MSRFLSMIVVTTVALTFALLCLSAQAKKPGSGGGGGGGGDTTEFHFTFVDLLGFPDRGYQSSPEFITEPDPATGRRFIAGSSRLYPDPDGPAVFHPAIWEVDSDGSFPASDPLDLGLPDWAREGDVSGLSDDGVVAVNTAWARYQDPENTSRYLFPAFVVAPFGYLQLPTPEERPGWPYGVRYRNSRITAINNNHLVVGSHEKLIRVEPDGTKVYVEGSGWYLEACVWHVPAGTVQGLGTLSRKGWNGSSIATGVNNDGQVVGWSDTGRRIPETAFLWEGNSMIDLNDLADTGSFQLIRAKGISNDGRIIGVLRDSRASEERGFVLVPIPESNNP